MQKLASARFRLTALVIVGSLATAAWAQSALNLTYKGDVVSSRVRIINGVAYVPVSDVARVLGGSVTKTSGDYEIAPVGDSQVAGGANQVQGQNGKQGEMVFTGKWRFEVLSVSRSSQFQTQYEPTPETVDPKGANDELVVVSCIAKNAKTQPVQLGLRVENVYNTALADNQGQSYPPIHFDFGGGSGYGPQLLPGAVCKFNAIFDVPKGTNVTSLVFSLWSYDDNNPHDVRIALAP